MKRRTVCCVMILSALTMYVARQTEGAISPSRVAEMKRAASDVFQIEVFEVKVDNEKEIKSNTLIKAKIVEVVRSSDPVTRGDWIEIESYEVYPDRLRPEPNEDELAKFIDAVFCPMSPPVIRSGWKGKVFLKAKGVKDTTKRFALAVFGHSFVQANAAPQKVNPIQPILPRQLHVIPERAGGEIERDDISRKGQNGGKPISIRDLETLASMVIDERVRAEIAKQVDFDKEQVILIAWLAASGSERRFARYEGTADRRTVVFYDAAPPEEDKTDDQCFHTYMWAIDKDIDWSFGPAKPSSQRFSIELWTPHDNSAPRTLNSREVLTDRYGDTAAALMENQPESRLISINNAKELAAVLSDPAARAAIAKHVDFTNQEKLIVLAWNGKKSEEVSAQMELYGGRRDGVGCSIYTISVYDPLPAAAQSNDKRTHLQIWIVGTDSDAVSAS